MSDEPKQTRRTVADADKEIAELKKQIVSVEKTSKEKELELIKEIDAMQDRDFAADKSGMIAGTGMKVWKASDYMQHRLDTNPMKSKPSIEELRAYINSKWTPKMFMEKTGIGAEELKQLVWKLSKSELRDTPIKYSIERNFFDRS